MKKRILLLFAIIMAMTAVYAQTPSNLPPIPPPPPPPPAQDREVFKVVEIKPSFPGCYDTRGSFEHIHCSDVKQLEFVLSHLEYPKAAMENGVEGTVYIKFIVEVDGSLTNFEIIRDIGFGCGEEALRVAKQMPKWEPGLHQGKPVAVIQNFPIRFSINGYKKFKKSQLEKQDEKKN